MKFTLKKIITPLLGLFLGGWLVNFLYDALNIEQFFWSILRFSNQIADGTAYSRSVFIYSADILTCFVQILDTVFHRVADRVFDYVADHETAELVFGCVCSSRKLRISILVRGDKL